MQQVSDAAETAVLGKTALGTTLAGAGTAMYGGYTLNEVAIILGIVAALGGLLVQIVVQWHAWRGRAEKARRDKEWHQARMAALSNWRDASTTPPASSLVFQDSYDDSQRGSLQ